MKLELKHLAPYLPYGLVVFIPIWKCERTISQLRQKSIVTKDFANHLLFTDIKPILRPLSDLTEKEKGELSDIVHSAWFESYEDLEIGTASSTEGGFNSYDIHDSYLVMTKLFEWHFDVFGLIEKGLAIDINTITK